MKRLFSLICLVVLTTGFATAQMGSHLKEEFHDAEAYGITIVERLSRLRAALLDEDVRVVCLQAFGEEIDEGTQEDILEWVREGHTIWFYDVRQASKFGMRGQYFEATELRTKPEDGVLGGDKHSGVATVAVSLGSHAVQTGVGQVTVFLPNIYQEDKEEPVYGGVEVDGDTVALLQSDLGSPALIALRREGKGLIVFKALLWNEPLSGDRFQMNLLEYSAGFQVPGPAGVGKVGEPPGPEAPYVEGDPAEPLTPGEAVAATVEAKTPQVGETPTPSTSVKLGDWTLELRDGTALQGVYEEKMVEFETGTRSLKLVPEKIVRLTFGDAVSLDKVLTDTGKEQSGLLLTTPVKFRTERGVEEFEKEDIKQLFRSKE